ncbi:thiol reductant ABC exporter subunit CydD [Actinoplanes sp. NPDC049265]|uniref:thiol reductant ABC exporter subunit CydD n=1 Tax=Actinoplanes sp. NPDC049265 TaxID=3363902 RepID=UPI00371C534E
MRPLDPRLIRYARTTRVFLAGTVALGLALAGLIVAQATLLADSITAVFLDGAGLAALTPALAWLAVVVAARALLSWAQEVLAARSAAGVKSELRARLLARLVERGPAGDTGASVTLVVRGLDALDAYFARYLPQLVLAALVPVIVLARLAPADLVATATVAVTLPLVPVFMALVGMHTEAANRRQFRRLSRLAHHFLDVVTGLPALKIFGRAKAQASIIRRFSDEQRRLTMRTLRTAFLSSLVLELLATLSVALVAVGIGLRLVSGHLDLATALLVLILAPEAYLPLRQVGANYHASAEGLAAAEDAFAILDAPVDNASVRHLRALHSCPPTGAGEAGGGANPGQDRLRFENVVVSYPDRAEPALRLDATIEPGETVALTGPSGSGKSTALNLLLGFVQPTTGSVQTPDRHRIAWVPQRPRLFAGTIRDNVRLGAGAATDVDIRRALNYAGAAEFVSALPDGLDTRLSDDGAGLSSGQRQRIALARAFLRDAPIVLLDEPTANLDAATAADVTAAIRRLSAGRTVLIAAHRPELIAIADRVITAGAR